MILQTTSQTLLYHTDDTMQYLVDVIVVFPRFAENDVCVVTRHDVDERVVHALRAVPVLLVRRDVFRLHDDLTR